MNRKILLLALFILGLGTTSLSAQTAFTANQSDVLLEKTAGLLHLNDENWSFYTDEESNTFFIDFETIKTNLSEIKLLDKNNEVVFKEDVLDLPVNTIYELDLSPFPKGNYTLELRSFTKQFAKAIQID